MAWNACHTSGPPPHLQLSPTYPSGNSDRPASSPRRNPIRLDPLDIPSVLWSWGFRICVCSCIAQWVPKRGSPPLLPLLRADSVRKSPLIYTQQLQRREVLLIGCCEIDVALPNFTCRGTWSIKTVPQKVSWFKNRMTVGEIFISRCADSVPERYLTQNGFWLAISKVQVCALSHQQV